MGNIDIEYEANDIEDPRFVVSTPAGTGRGTNQRSYEVVYRFEAGNEGDSCISHYEPNPCVPYKMFYDEYMRIDSKNPVDGPRFH